MSDFDFVCCFAFNYNRTISHTKFTYLVTVMWANEQFDPEHPDTFGEKV